MKATIYAEIPYEVGETKRCITPCPYNETLIDGTPVRVGSLCCITCAYSVGYNETDKIVRCSHPDARN